MRLKSLIICLFLLLATSTAISFVGYRYLSLASEYRERNMIHLSEAYALIDTLDSAPEQLRPNDIARARQHLNGALTQAQWCLAVLSEAEKRLFRILGAGPALEVCAHNVDLARAAFGVLDAVAATLDVEGAALSPAIGQVLRDHAQDILADSFAFQPYVSVIEDKVSLFVRWGTACIGFGLALALLCIGRDIILAQRMQARQTQELTKLAAIAERANDAITVTDPEGIITWVNPAFEALTGYGLDEVEGHKPGAILQGEGTSEEARRQIAQAMFKRVPVRTDILNYRKTGESYWVNLSIAPLTEACGALSGFVALASDITKDRAFVDALEAANDRIIQQARQDPLTELPNRRFIDEVMDAEVTNSDAPRTLVRIDLDHFKNVNDTLGHAAGDFVLRKVADVMRAHVRENDVAARVGGDEFVILLAAGTTEEDAVILTERLRQQIREDMHYEDQTCRIGASFGVASALTGLIPNEDLLKSADAALYVAKAMGRDATHLYTPCVHASVLEKRSLSLEIARGIELGAFEAYFQPQFDAETQVLVGIEALARWRHPTRGVLTPDAFLPVAEQLKLVPEIDRQVINYGLDRMADLNGEGLFVPKISFNAGLAQITNPDLARIVRSKDIGFTRVSLEILESVLLERQDAEFLERINDLRFQDFGIEMDDFGSGHASVISLQK
ncbi:MAG: diguanylate cyclase, partial [Pseudomonadota bacterium]